MTKEDIDVEMKALSALFGSHKANINSNGDIEGIWVVPESQADLDKYNDNTSRGELIRIRMDNDALYIPCLVYGTHAVALTSGNERPVITSALCKEHDAELNNYEIWAAR
jgi:hypothetical protein